MFTGIITHRGCVVAVDDVQVTVAAPEVTGGLEPGGSVAVAGICLTVTDIGDEQFIAVGITETRTRTTLDELGSGATVNLELPLRVGSSLDGHLVQGHVDAVGKIMAVTDEPVGRRMWVRHLAGSSMRSHPRGRWRSTA